MPTLPAMQMLQLPAASMGAVWVAIVKTLDDECAGCRQDIVMYMCNKYFYDGEVWDDCPPPPKTAPPDLQPSKPAPLQPKPEAAVGAPPVKLSKRAAARKLKAELRQLDIDMQKLRPQLLTVRLPGMHACSQASLHAPQQASVMVLSGGRQVRGSRMRIH